jgi:hypothetical protein
MLNEFNPSYIMPHVVFEFVAPFGALHRYRPGFGHAPIPTTWSEGNFAKDPKYGMCLPPKYVNIEVVRIPSKKIGTKF